MGELISKLEVDRVRFEVTTRYEGSTPIRTVITRAGQVVFEQALGPMDYGLDPQAFVVVTATVAQIQHERTAALLRAGSLRLSPAGS